MDLHYNVSKNESTNNRKNTSSGLYKPRYQYDIRTGLERTLGPNGLIIWIACEITSILLTLMLLYFLISLIRHALQQTNSKVARRKRDSILFASRMQQSDNYHQPRRCESESSVHHSVGFARSSVIPGPRYLQEQISVESSGGLVSNNVMSGQQKINTASSQIVAVQRTRTHENSQGKCLIRMIVLCVFLAFLRCLEEQALLLFGHTSDVACDVLNKAMIVLTALSLHSCHVFLWMRQLTFYSNSLLKPLRSKKLKVMSYAAYAIMPITLALSLALFMWWRDYGASTGGCQASEPANLTPYVPFGVLAACTVTIQVLLSSLFLYPLIAHKMKRRPPTMRQVSRESTRGITTAGPPESPAIIIARRSRPPDKLMACIKRVLYGATVGITTDVVGGLIGMFISTDIPMFALSVLYNMNVSLNVLCLIYTFANWKEMLFPMCYTPPEESQIRRASQRRRQSVRQVYYEAKSKRKFSLKLDIIAATR